MSRRGSSRLAGRLAVGLTAGVAIAVVTMAVDGARAETLEFALIQAYQNNPTLNAQRASVRVTDEGVPQALSGYRPKMYLTASGGEQIAVDHRPSTGRRLHHLAVNAPAMYVTQSGYNAPFGDGATVTQTLFNGFQTANRTRQAESAGAGGARDACARPSRRCCSTR